MTGAEVLLLSMPWEDLEYPSIQLGILQATLRRAGIKAETRSLKLDFLEHCTRADRGLSVGSYRAVVEWSRDVSIGDWIFSTASGPASKDDPYLEFLRDYGLTKTEIESGLRFRAQVPEFLEVTAEEIAAARPAIVGFTTAFNQTLASIALAERIRARLGDGVRIIFGGANCEGPMGAALHRAYPVIDVVVRGEGERVLPELARDLLASRPPRAWPGLCYRNTAGDQIVVEEAAGDVPLDEVPTPEYEEYFDRLSRTSFRAELQPDLTLFYESARGCWWGEKSHCSFCGISDLAMPFRAKSPDRVVSELQELAGRYGLLEFLFVDYILNRRYLDEVLPRLRDSEYDFRIFCETKANLRRDEVQLLADSGFTIIQAGVESLSTPVLKLMRKGVTGLQNLRLLKWCAEYGVRLYWNVIYGIPGEPVEEYEWMARLVPSLTHLEPPRLVPLQLDRFSPHYERPEDFGIVPLGPRRDFRFVFPADRVDDAALAEIAYSFEFRHADGRDPETYTAPMQRAVREWQASGRSAIGTLRYRRGPGFLLVTDRRPGVEPAEYRLAEAEARLYLACEDGATAEQASRHSTSSVEEVERFLDELVAKRLACKVDGRYLALALPPAARRVSRPVRGLEETLTARVAAVAQR
jgi:ribosomal peptide maturation radical SAM protein 1